jgi:signal transduction histidine kinase
MKKSPYTRYIETGVAFVRDHPQLWFTAFVGISILGAFLLVSYRFASIAQEAQEELINVRIGSILDTFVVFAPEVLNNQERIRSHIQTIAAQNTTIEQFSLVAPHGNNAYRQYITLSGEREGTLIDDSLVHFIRFAEIDPENAYTMPVTMGSDRYFMTARAITGDTGVEAIAVTSQSLSEADRRVSTSLRDSTLLLIAIVILIMLLFIRHARIVDYAALYKKLLEVDELKDSFISMASHELKSPLAVIRGYIEYLKDDFDDVEKRLEYLRRIDVSAEELRQLIDDILDVSRIEMGRLRFTPEYVSVVPVLEEVTAMFTEAAKSKELTVSLEVDDTARETTVRLDRGRFKQVMVNLLSNAIKYTLAGSIRVEASVAQGMVTVSVRDTGIGMTREEQEKLFGKFYRVEADEAKGVSGTGLGLWITRYIVEHMDGTISVESIKGEGSRFVVTFPVAQTNTEQDTTSE